MLQQYSYQWFIQQFENTKDTAEEFILSVDKNLFLKAPAEGRWSIAECYSHLINYGDLYFDNIASAISKNADTANSVNRSFPPRWLAQKIISYFEPPYKIKLKTIKSMKPVDTSGYNRMDLLDEYLNLQNRLIAQLETAHQKNVHLGRSKVSHPIFSIIKMTLSECFLLLEAHQRRHQWQAEQTLKALQNNQSE
ncbi:DinB family protein [Fodinibius sp.]|uniref:DinB family protein n=1 Tax=Fodinibius sp. TaxID=1872440 RepID=UPI002ACEB356|nr:DinB family protein [Fodinibius sp.]MDZ7658376.1 DinB family protein [Fodinibius sp.]